MSAEDVSKFHAHIKKDPALEAKVTGLQDNDRQKMNEKLAEIGKSHGYSFTAAEADSFLKSNVKGGALSDDALKSVAGGAGGGLRSGSWTYSWPGCN